MLTQSLAETVQCLRHLAATMPTTRKNSPTSVYQLHVRLLHQEPTVWRRLWVPDTLTLAGLHKVLQATMGRGIALSPLPGLVHHPSSGPSITPALSAQLKR